jgi:uncharacterized membrane protein
MKWLLIIVIVIAAPIVIMYLIGYFMPVQHVSSHTVLLNAPPEQVWNVLQDHRQYPTWRSDVKKVEVKDPLHWTETTTNGTLSFESEIAKPSALFHSKIVNQNLPFGGSWTYELVPGNGSTRLTITEHGEVYNPIFRFMSKYVFGHEATLKKFGQDLSKKINSK